MKKLIYLSLIVAITSGCRPENDAVIGEPGSKLEGINAEWILTAAQVQDNRSINGDSISLTSYYKKGGAPEISFNSTNFTYNVVANDKRNFFGTGGTWAFDDDQFPTIITLTTNEGVAMVLDLTSTIRPQDPRLRVNYSRECDGETYVTYYFEYTRK